MFNFSYLEKGLGDLRIPGMLLFLLTGMVCWREDNRPRSQCKESLNEHQTTLFNIPYAPTSCSVHVYLGTKSLRWGVIWFSSWLMWMIQVPGRKMTGYDQWERFLWLKFLKRVHTDEKPRTTYLVWILTWMFHYAGVFVLSFCQLKREFEHIQRISCLCALVVLSRQECNAFVFKISCPFKPITCVFFCMSTFVHMTAHTHACQTWVKQHL